MPLCPEPEGLPESVMGRRLGGLSKGFFSTLVQAVAAKAKAEAMTLFMAPSISETLLSSGCVPSERRQE